MNKCVFIQGAPRECPFYFGGILFPFIERLLQKTTARPNFRVDAHSALQQVRSLTRTSTARDGFAGPRPDGKMANSKLH